MAKFRKIQVEIEAVQYLGMGKEGCPIFSDMPDWLLRAMSLPIHITGAVCAGQAISFVRTLEGPADLNLGSWIIRGIEGELYPCSDSVFRKTYEPCGLEHVDQLAAKASDSLSSDQILSKIREVAKKYSPGLLGGWTAKKLASAGALEEYVLRVAKRRCEIEVRIGGESWDSLGILARDERRRQARLAVMHAMAMQELGLPAPQAGEG